MNEQICFSLDTFENCNKHLLSELYSTSKFADITLISDDQVPIKLHKFVLSFHSTVFKSLLENDFNQTCIYLRGVSSSALRIILQFMYLGETVVPQESLAECKSFAKDLGLQEVHSKLDEFKGITLDNKVKEPMMKPGEFSCGLCGAKFSDQIDLKKHKRTFHYKSEISCDLCEAKFSEKGHLKRHKMSIHEKSRFLCQRCDSQFSRIDTLNHHINTVHNNVNYDCDYEDCGYKTPTLYKLNEHINISHKGVRFPCEQCDFQSTRRSGLKKHMNTVHAVIKYSCQQCDYITPISSRFRRHMKLEHESPAVKAEEQNIDNREGVLQNNFHGTNVTQQQYKLHSCRKCDFIASKESLLQPHVLANHIESSFS